MTKPAPYDYLVKLLLVGDSGCGKSNMLLKYSDNMFMSNFISTIGIDFKIKTIEIDGKIVKLQIWDTAGQERFRTITTAYYRGAMGIMIVYSVTDKKSFDNVNPWIKNIMNHSNRNAKLLLIGNKIDCEVERVITYEQGKELMAHYNMSKTSGSPTLDYMEVSAKDGTNIDYAFTHLASRIVKDIAETQNNEVSNGNLIIDDKKKTKKGFRCNIL